MSQFNGVLFKEVSKKGILILFIFSKY